MRFVYLNMDAGHLCDSEDDLTREIVESCGGVGPLPTMAVIPNLAGTETLVAAGHIEFTNAEALAVHRHIQMGVPIAGTRH